ncbi:hypothetical protein ACF0H5_024045 [Mactra antiquata]
MADEDSSCKMKMAAEEDGKSRYLGRGSSLDDNDENKGASCDKSKTGIVGKFVKQQSLPEDTNDRHRSWIGFNSNANSSDYSGMFLSPYGSSNTLTGSMYTASEGMHTSRSGMTSFSGNTDFYLTPQISSLASFQNSDISDLDHMVYYSCHSNLKLMLENENNEDLEKEKNDNELNEIKLRDIKVNTKDTKDEKPKRDSFKNKILKGVYKRNSSKKKRAHEHAQQQSFHEHAQKQSLNLPPDKNFVQMVAKTDDIGTKQTAPKVIHGILKSSVSSDSDSYRHGNRQSEASTVKLGGTKTLLIEKPIPWCLCENLDP